MIMLFEHTGSLAWNDKKVDLNSQQPKRQNHASGFKSCFFFGIDRFELYVVLVWYILIQLFTSVCTKVVDT